MLSHHNKVVDELEMASRMINSDDLAEVLAGFDEVDQEYFNMENRELDIADRDHQDISLNITDEPDDDPECNTRDMNEDRETGEVGLMEAVHLLHDN